ncbi:MAG: YggS family pyridoxal phosphate-dependent enzyme [Nitrospiraceae bacterium]|nr:MAG: YggS family pyridoxal phosphate-dependent enzyme [Nitrospiraceae bacterium]
MGIPENLAAIRERICNAAAKAKRDPQDIKLVAVTKTVGLQKIAEAVSRGILILGENRVQEAQRKISNLKFEISNFEVEWHLIGHLQKNKAKYAVRLFDLIQTVDSTGLAKEINIHSEKHGKVQRVLVQVKLSDETAKHGTIEKDVMSLIRSISEMKHLALEGLMTMPPYFEDPEMTRPYFRRLRQMRDDVEKAGFSLPELSMGMSHDFEVAIEEGATMVRVGTALFGERTQ